jgi:hypothetical protein
LFELLPDTLVEKPEFGSVKKRGTPIILRRTIVMLSAKNGRSVGIDDYASKRCLSEYGKPFPGCIKV